MAWEFKDDRPIYTQLLEQIQRMIISGKYKPGDRLPTVRDLASEAAVNPNTVQRALTELERIGLVYSQRTSGRMITDDESKIAEIKEKMAEDLIKKFCSNMKELGYSKKEIIELLEKIGFKNIKLYSDFSKYDTECERVIFVCQR